MANVYSIKSPTGKIYVGSSVDMPKRLAQYKRLDCKSQPKIYNSLLKHGPESHIFDILIECEPSEMLRLEAEFGEKFDVLGPNGLNCSLPKKIESYQSRSEESREKTRKSLMGNKNGAGVIFSKERRNKMSKSRENYKHSDETLIKMRDSHKGQIPWCAGKQIKQSTKDLLREINLGKKQSREHAEKAAKTRFKIVLDLQAGVFYDSVIDAANYYPHSYRYLIQMLCGRKRNQTNLIYA